MVFLIRTVKALSIILVMFFLPNCSSQLAFEAVNNSWVDDPSRGPITYYEEVKKEIDVFTVLLAKHDSRHLNSRYITDGLLALAEKKFVTANDNFQRALKFDPQNALLHMLNALTYQLRGDAGDPDQYKMAEVGYELAARMDPGDSKVHYYMGVLQFKLQKFLNAQEYFANAIMHDANQPEYYMGLAAASYYLGELGRAYANIEKALTLSPLQPTTLQASGIIYASIGAFDKAYSSADLLGNVSRVRQKYLQQRIKDWENFYAQNNIKEDEQIKDQMAQNLDIFGVPKKGMFDPTDSDTRDPLRRTEEDDSGFADQGDTTPPLPPGKIIPGTSAKPGASQRFKKAPSPTPAVIKPSVPVASKKEPALKKSPPPVEVKKKPVHKKLEIPQMALVDVAIIRTEEIYKTSKGVNLLDGLNVFFSNPSQFLLFPTASALGGLTRTPATTNDSTTLKLGIAGAGLTYSLNIFSDNYDRNEVIARPTILVQHKKKSKFFSGSILHIVIEGGVAGSGSIQPISTGVKLEVTPNFLDSETIDFSVYVERTFLEATLSEVSSNITGTTFAQTSTTSISANLTLRYGETMVLSGLSDQEKEIIDDKVPLIGDLPGIQYFFRKQEKTSAKKTILVLLTPRKAGLTYQTGEPIEKESGKESSRVDKLEKTAPWMRPASHLKAFVRHLSKYEFFNYYRKGDLRLENWAGEKTIRDAILRTLDYLYIYYDFEKKEKSSL